MSIQNLGVHNKDGSLQQPQEYLDGKTKQCFKDECDIKKIMSRADKAGTISHLEKYQGVYADFSDFDFHKQTRMLTRGREIFDALPAELRQEFAQSPAAFFEYVNDPANIDELRKKLPDLAKPGQQLIDTESPTADKEAALDAASEPVVSEKPIINDPPKVDPIPPVTADPAS